LRLRAGAHEKIRFRQAVKIIKMSARTQRIAAAFVIFLAAVALRLPTVNAPFYFDDFHVSVENPSVTGPLDFSRILTDPAAFSSKPGRRMYRPLTLLTYAINYRIGGENPAGWHAFSLAVHGLSALLVFGIAFRLFSGKLLVPTTTALIWAAHPLLNEAVVYQAARSSLLAALFALAAVYFHLSVKGDKARAALAAVFTILGLASKETAAVIPALLFLADVPHRRNMKTRWPSYAVALGVFIAYVIYRMTVLDVPTFHISTPVRSVFSNLLTQSTIIPAYADRFLWPVGLSIEWNRPVFHSLFPQGSPLWRWPAMWMPVLLIVIAAAIAGWRRWPFFTVGAGWFLAALAPESSIIPLVQAANERRLYLPLAGLAILAGVLLKKAAEKKPKGAVACVSTVIACFALLTLADAGRWNSELDLYASALARNPDSLRALHGVATASLKAGNVEGAEFYYRKLVREHPGYGGGYIGLGRILLERHRYKEATKYFTAAARLDDNNQVPWINLSLAYLNAGEPEKAESAVRAALEKFPREPRLWNNLGAALASRGKLKEAISAFDRALRLDPRNELAAANRATAISELESIEKNR